ncbi:MAG: methyltransferase domain-containing protein, partial [Pelagibacterales bacterium]|nr:methyltransferase domain-containing protein [Pelagibacterales bacterium]
MRIVAGKFRGKNLVKSDHLKDLRPTTDKNREALFNILSSGKNIKELGFKILNSNVLDVCCGTGAVAFEALSRGANSAFLIDKNQTHLKIVKENILNLGLQNSVEVLAEDVFK